MLLSFYFFVLWFRHVQIHDSVSGSIFVRMISDLFDSVDVGLRRKALELLSAKLTSLAADRQPVPILDPSDPNGLSHQLLRRGNLSKRRSTTSLDLALETGLIQFTAQLASQYNLSKSDGTEVFAGPSCAKETSGLFSSSFSRQSLACLRDLAKLLADRYPGEFSRVRFCHVSFIVFLSVCTGNTGLVVVSHEC